MELSNFLVSHQELIPYISIQSLTSSPGNQPAPDIQKYLHSDLIEKLTKLISDQSVKQLPMPAKPEAKPLYLGGVAALTYHKLQYLNIELQKRDQKRFDVFCSHIVDLINLLKGGGIPSTQAISIDIQRFAGKHFSHDCHYSLLLYERNRCINFINNQNEIVKNKDAQKKLFYDKLILAISQFDQNSSFLKQVEIQDNLELLFEYEDFALHNKLNEVVLSYRKEKSQDFIKELISLVYELLAYFELKELKNGDNVLILFIFRYAFDKLYSFQLSPLNRERFDPSRLTNIDSLSHYLSNCTFEQLRPPDECCPPHTPEMRVSEVFRMSSDYFPAVQCLEGITFHTNPIDALNSIRDCLIHIEIAVNKIHPTEDTMLPFEVTFGLFLCVAAAAHIPELQIFTDFIDECVPNTGLNPIFDFAHTKLTAATSHLRKIINIKQKEEFVE